MHAAWLKQYSPMVAEGTWAWLEIGESTLFQLPLPANTVASAFANRDLHLVLANYGTTPVQVATVDAYVPVNDASARPERTWDLAGRSLRIVRRQDRSDGRPLG